MVAEADRGVKADTESDAEPVRTYTCYTLDQALTAEEQDLIEGMDIRIYRACSELNPTEYVFYGLQHLLDLLHDMLKHMQDGRRVRNGWP
jgi:hypothetical protein